jgi:hypothetical protein
LERVVDRRAYNHNKYKERTNEVTNQLKSIMDFSSPARALESLGRRRPALPDTVLEAAKVLQQPFSNNCSPTEYLNAVHALIMSTQSSQEKPRWEGLAVGILLATQLLLDDAQPSIVVFLEGPRFSQERKEE